MSPIAKIYSHERLDNYLADSLTSYLAIFVTSYLAITVTSCDLLRPLLLTWIYSNPNMDK